MHSVTLPVELSQFVEQQIARGAYMTEDDLIQSAVQLLYDREQETARLQAAAAVAIESLDRGEGIELQDDDELREFMEELKRECRAEFEQSQV